MPYIKNIEPSVKADIFETVANLNSKLVDIEYSLLDAKIAPITYSSKNKVIVTLGSMLQKSFSKMGSEELYPEKKVTVKVVPNSILHHFETDILVKVGVDRDGSNGDDAFEKIVNIEVEGMLDYLTLQKVRNVKSCIIALHYIMLFET